MITLRNYITLRNLSLHKMKERKQRFRLMSEGSTVNSAILRKQNLAKNRQAVANGFHHQNRKFSASPGTGIPLHIVKRKFE